MEDEVANLREELARARENAEKSEARRAEMEYHLEQMQRQLRAPAMVDNGQMMEEMRAEMDRILKERDREREEARLAREEAERLRRANEHLESELSEGDEEEWSGTEISSTPPSPSNEPVVAIPFAVEAASPVMHHHRQGEEIRIQRLPAETESSRLFIPAANRTVERIHPIQHSRPPPLNDGAPPPPAAPPEEVNGWSAETQATARKWQADIEKSSFIYGELLDHNTNRMQQTLVATLLLGALSTLLSAISVTLGALLPNNTAAACASEGTVSPTAAPVLLGLDVDVIMWTLFVFSIVQTLAGIGILVWNGLMKIWGWDTMVRQLTRFVQRLDSEWFVFETELNIPVAQRQNGSDFIKRADGNYMHLMQQCPPISGPDYVAANQAYQERLFDNFVWQQKFKKRMHTELTSIDVQSPAHRGPPADPNTEEMV